MSRPRTYDTSIVNLRVRYITRYSRCEQSRFSLADLQLVEIVYVNAIIEITGSVDMILKNTLG